MLVRPASEVDVAQLVALMLDYIVDFYRQPDPGESAVTGLVQDLLNNPGRGRQWVAEINGELIGFATLYITCNTLPAKQTGILNDLYVAPKMRGRHVGESLFKTVLSHVRDQGLAGLEWATATDNLAAQSLYRKMGGRVSPWLHFEME